MMGQLLKIIYWLGVSGIGLVLVPLADNELIVVKGILMCAVYWVVMHPPE
jgi:hypothetical protein